MNKAKAYDISEHILGEDNLKRLEASVVTMMIVFACAILIGITGCGSSGSAPTPNSVPVARAATDQNVVTGTLVTLDASTSSDGNNDPLTYSWSLIGKPYRSGATLSNATAIKPTFTADIAGTYLAFLVVNDGKANSSKTLVTVAATIPSLAPVVPTTKTIVAVETSVGIIKIALYEDLSPLSSKNFLDYINAGFYTNTIFHRVIPGFMIQGGGFTSDLIQKTTNPPVNNEAANGLKNIRGTVAMARTSVVNSATSQFFINVVDNKTLDYTSPTTAEYGYAVFGTVVEGMDIVDKIAAVTTGTSNSMSDVPVVPIVINSVSVLP